MIKNGANINAKNKDGHPPIHRAACYDKIGHSNIGYDHIGIVKLFLSYGADPTIIDNYGKRASDYAENKEVKNLLLYAERII